MVGKIFLNTKNTIFVLTGTLMVGLIVFMAYSIFLTNSPQNPKEFKAGVFKYLRDLRIQKKAEAFAFLRHQLAIVKKVKTDPQYIEAFSEMLSLFESRKYGTANFLALNNKWERMYVNEFGMFYDILLLDSRGTIFYTVRMERDFLTNIESQLFQGLGIKEGIKNLKNNITFIDYEYYGVSEEPASFFLVPLFSGSKNIGTIVFQLPLNEINRILTDYSDLKKTEEVYLVNQNRLMLTDSRFLNDEVILHKKIETEAVRNAMRGGEGEGVIIDYRGKRVFSSYEKFEFEGTSWIIIAEVDEEEIITDLFKIWQDKIFDKILKIVADIPIVFTEKNQINLQKENYGKNIRIDLKEYGRTSEKRSLYTVGVATCTAISIHIPKKFGYLLHITPTDEIYNIGRNESLLLGRAYTNMVDEVMKKILWFDIHQYEQGLLQYGVFSTQADSLKTAIWKLMENGAMLAQIKLLYKPSYMTVSLEVDHDKDRVLSFWGGNNGRKNGELELDNVPDLETVFKKAIGY